MKVHLQQNKKPVVVDVDEISVSRAKNWGREPGTVVVLKDGHVLQVDDDPESVADLITDAEAEAERRERMQADD